MIDSKENIKFDLGIKGQNHSPFSIKMGSWLIGMELISLGRVVSHFKILV